MKFRLDPALYDGVSTDREREWRQSLTELNTDFSDFQVSALRTSASPDGPAPTLDTTLTLNRHSSGGVEVTVEVGDHTELVELGPGRMRRHFKEYREVIEQLARSTSGRYGMRDLETLDYAKKLAHDDAAETVQEAFEHVVELEHKLARRLFTLVFLVSNALPEDLVTRHRHQH